MSKTVFICLAFIFMGCSPNPLPKGILANNKMENIVYDLMQADEYLNNLLLKGSLADSKKKRSIFYEQIFKLHNTSRKEFYTSYRYYQQHPDIQKTLFDSLYAKAGRRKTSPARPIPVKQGKIN